MYVDSMNDEGFEEIWRERFYECGSYERLKINFGERERLGEIWSWRVGGLEDVGKNNRPWQVYIN